MNKIIVPYLLFSCLFFLGMPFQVECVIGVLCGIWLSFGITEAYGTP